MKKVFPFDNVVESLRKKHRVKVVMAEDGKTYLHFRHKLLHLAVPIESKRTLTILEQLVREHLGFSITKPQAKAVLEILEAKAVLAPSKPIHVFRRVGEVQGSVVVLLNAQAGLVAKITKKGVKIRQGSVGVFLYSESAKSLPEPNINADHVKVLEEFRELTSLSSPHFKLLILMILCAYSPHGPYFVGIVLGGSGSAKSMLVKMFKLLTDPEKVLTRNIPVKERDLHAAAMNAHVIVYDNVSVLPQKISDAISRTSCGGGSTRSMGRSDEDELVFWASRVYLLNGIDNFVAQDDLLQRAVRLRTNRIETDQRLLEREMRHNFERLRPKLLGVIFNALAHCLKHIEEVDLAGKLPRMADMTEWAVAAGDYFGWPAEKIVKAFEKNQREAFTSYAEADVVVWAVTTLIGQNGDIHCPPTELFFLLGEFAKNANKTTGYSIKGFPSTPSALGSRLRRSSEALKVCGVEYSTSATHEGRMVHLCKISSDSKD